MLSPRLVGTLQILTGLGALLLLKPAYENREKPGSIWFGIFTAGVGSYALAAGGGLLTADYTVSLALKRIVVTSGTLTSVAWLGLAVGMANTISVTRRKIAAATLYLLLAWLAIWLNPGRIVIGADYGMMGTQLDPDYQLGFWVLLGMGYLYIVFGTGLFAIESLNSTGIRRRQAGLLALAIVPAFVASVGNGIMEAQGGVVYDYTVFGWAGTVVMFAVALYSARFLDISALARRLAMGEMPDAMVTLDEQNRIVDCNAAARELFAIGDEYVGTPASMAFEDVDPDPLSRLDGGSPSKREVLVQCNDEQRHCSLSTTPISGAVGQGRVLVFHDITAQKRREAKLAQQNEQLEKFAKTVSHDLRNPLNLASGHVELADETGDAEHFETIRDAHTRIETMVDELLTLARAGQTVEATDPVRVSEVIDQAWGAVETTDCTRTLDISDELSIEADHDRLLHVFENLFRNAVEHNDQPVTVRIATLPQSDATADTMGLVIEDDGGGLPAIEPDTLFEHGYTTTDDGTGLGLSIVRDIVEAHGWSIRVTDGEMEGARFEITGIESIAEPDR